MFQSTGFLRLPATLLMVFFLASAALAQEIDLQGHRGARGLMPENTLPGFARALTIGVSTLELDLGVSRDRVVVVSHNPELDPAITRTKAGQWLNNKDAVISAMNYEELKQFDVGRINPASRYASRFPDQIAVDGTAIPTLAQVFELVKRSGNVSVRFNIETKLNPEKPDLTLSPSEFIQTLLKVIERYNMSPRVSVQSFDWRTLQVIQKLAPEIPTAYLSVAQPWFDTLQRGKPGASAWLSGLDIDDFQQSVPRAVKAAGGRIWSPYYKEVTKEKIDLAHQLGLKVNVWTVNETRAMQQLITMGVDGIITDYPDRLRSVLLKLGLPVPAATPVE